jgi:shikimate dehydrogenase
MMNVFRWQDAPIADFAVIGDPIAHSLSPKMHTAAYNALGMTYKYVAIRVPAGRGGAALERLRHLGYKGVNVTVPHKEEALEWVTQSDPVSRRTRACNTVKPQERSGINTDMPGFLETLESFGFQPGQNALILGAGGSARAIAAALEEAHFHLAIYNRTPENASRLVASLGLSAPVLDTPDVSGFDLIVNTTSASLEGAEVHIDWTRAKPTAVAYDLTYMPILTPFLEPASKVGVQCMDGKALLVAQGARSFEWWLGVEAPREVMTKAIR